MDTGQDGAGNLAEYFNSSAPTYKRHITLITVRFGYRDLHHSPEARLGLMRLLYEFCWNGEDKPVRLIEWACDRLISNRILLRGPTTLERLVRRIREGAQGRLWQILVDGLTADQRKLIGSLLEQDNESLGVWIYYVLDR